MDFVFTKEEEKVISEVREFIKKESTPELLKETHELERIYGGKLGREFIKKFAAKGWLCPNWPEEYGGLNMSEMLTYMIKDEIIELSIAYGVISPFTNYSGPGVGIIEEEIPEAENALIQPYELLGNSPNPCSKTLTRLPVEKTLLSLERLSSRDFIALSTAGCLMS